MLTVETAVFVPVCNLSVIERRYAILCTLPGRGRYLEGEKPALFRSVNTHRTLTERPLHQNNVLGRIVPDHDEAKRSSRGAAITLGSSASDVSGSAHGRWCFGDSSGHIRRISDNSCEPFHHHLQGGIAHGCPYIDSTYYRWNQRDWPGGRHETGPAWHPYLSLIHI